MKEEKIIGSQNGIGSKFFANKRTNLGKKVMEKVPVNPGVLKS